MDKVLPIEILIKIFMYLTVDDIESVASTCLHWKNIIENYNIWKEQWVYLLNVCAKINLKYSSYLQNTNISDINLKKSSIRLRNLIYNKHNEIYKCFTDGKVKTYEYGILKTHYSHITLTYKNNSSVNHYLKCVNKSNDALPTCESYVLFRSLPKLLNNIDYVFSGHGHVEQLVYIYPLGVSDHLEEIVSRLISRHHAAEVVLLPRVLALCQQLFVQDAVVVFSTGRSTEVALVCDGTVPQGRWAERPVAGWRVAQNLHACFSWQWPRSAPDARHFDKPSVKALCWVPYNTQAHCEDNSSQVLGVAGEQMYVELGLGGLIRDLTEGISGTQLRRCLEHVLLSGGNSRLQHLAARVRRDLMSIWPEHAAVVTTSVHNISPLVYSTLLEIPPPISSHPIPGELCRITRNSYLVAEKQTTQ